jgi:hypothetical protein
MPVWFTAALFIYGVASHHRKIRDEMFWEADKPTAHDMKLIKHLSMRVMTTYIRDEMFGIPSGSGICNTAQRMGAHFFNNWVHVDPRVVQENQFWTRMEDCGVTEEEERMVGITHYLRRDNHPKPGAVPALIITCRDTILRCQDAIDDVRVGLGLLRRSPRYPQCEGLIVKHFRASYGGDDPSDIWITGHSLGADIALLARMELSAQKIKVSLLCFNSPLLTVLSISCTVFWINTIIDTLWNVKEMLGEICRGLELLTDQLVKLNDIIKLEFANRLDREEVQRQLNRFKALEMGPVLSCVNEGDFVCKKSLKFYRRNHKKGRSQHLSLQAMWSRSVQPMCPIMEKHGAPNYFCMPPSVTMFWTKKSKGSHSLKQWFDPNIVMKKANFQLG